MTSLRLLPLVGFAVCMEAHAETDPFDQVARMRRGVNIIGHDPIWKELIP